MSNWPIDRLLFLLSLLSLFLLIDQRVLFGNGISKSGFSVFCYCFCLLLFLCLWLLLIRLRRIWPAFVAFGDFCSLSFNWYQMSRRERIERTAGEEENVAEASKMILRVKICCCCCCCIQCCCFCTFFCSFCATFSSPFYSILDFPRASQNPPTGARTKRLGDFFLLERNRIQSPPAQKIFRREKVGERFFDDPSQLIWLKPNART